MRRDIDVLLVSGREIEHELDYLRNRETNIPYQNARIRDELSKVLKIDRNRLPFIGECLQVREILNE